MVRLQRENGPRWPSDRPLVPQQFVADYKRERCALALAEIVHEVGVGGLTVTMTIKQARMGRPTFYELFGGQEDALRWAIDLGNRRLREAVEAAASEDLPQGARVEATVRALEEAMEREPTLIELSLVHGCGRLEPGVGPHDPKLVEELADALAGELLAHALLWLIGDRLRRGEADSLGGGQLTKLVEALSGDRHLVP